MFGLFRTEKRTYQRPVKVLPSIPPQMTSTMTHHYDSSHDKLTSAINQRLLSSHEFIEDYSTMNPHQSKCQLDIRLDAHFNLIPDLLPVDCWLTFGSLSGDLFKVLPDLVNARH